MNDNRFWKYTICFSLAFGAGVLAEGVASPDGEEDALMRLKPELRRIEGGDDANLVCKRNYRIVLLNSATGAPMPAPSGTNEEPLPASSAAGARYIPGTDGATVHDLVYREVCFRR